MASEVVGLFAELAALPSPPGDERAVADAVIRYLRDLGLTVDEDRAGGTVGSNIGNLYCRLEPTNGGVPIARDGHLRAARRIGNDRSLVPARREYRGHAAG